jgi:DNA primase
LVPGKTLSFAQLPQGEDPDSLIRIQGVESMREVLARATPLAEVLWNQVMDQEARTPEAKAAQEAQLMQRVGQIKHPTVQHYYKQFMRDKLRVAQQPAPQSKFVPYQKGKGQKPQGVNAPPAPFLPRDVESALVLPVAKLVALVVTHPSLLQDANAEEAWLSVPLPSPALTKLHQRITEAHIEHPALSADGLAEMLREDAFDLKPIDAALKDLGIARAPDETMRVMMAQRLWPEVMDDIDKIRLKAEFKEVEAEMAGDMTDEVFNRYLALKQQLESLERERTRFYREDPVQASGQ